ncbi:cell division protein SepF [Lachnospiraceae bacterium LCP25S3_G4]
MGVLDKFLDIMKLSDEDDYDSDDFFDDEDDFDDYEDKPRKAMFKKEKATYDEYDDEDDRRGGKTSKASQNSKVTPMRQPAKRSSGMEVCVVKPNSVDDAREITETLLSNRTVILNLEGLDLEVAQRIIDFTSGATFAITGNLQKISNYIFLVTPTNVDISGDLQDLLSSSFEVPSIRTRF